MYFLSLILNACVLCHLVVAATVPCSEKKGLDTFLKQQHPLALAPATDDCDIDQCNKECSGFGECTDNGCECSCDPLDCETLCAPCPGSCFNTKWGWSCWCQPNEDCMAEQKNEILPVSKQEKQYVLPKVADCDPTACVESCPPRCDGGCFCGLDGACLCDMTAPKKPMECDPTACQDGCPGGCAECSCFLGVCTCFHAEENQAQIAEPEAGKCDKTKCGETCPPRCDGGCFCIEGGICVCEMTESLLKPSMDCDVGDCSSFCPPKCSHCSCFAGQCTCFR